MSAPAAEGGNRLTWTDLPPAIRRLIEREAGAAVVEAVNQPGGFSPGLASRLRLADGRRVFAKSVSAARNPDSPDHHRREARVLAVLPAAAPAPRLLWFGEHDVAWAPSGRDRWTVLLIEDVDGRNPAQPWQPDEFDQVVRSLQLMAEVLTPNPVPGVAHVVDDLAEDFSGWRGLAAGVGARPERFDWAWHNLNRLVALEAAWPAAAAGGDTLLHCDLRADNMLVTERGVVVVDWPAVTVGPAWVDLLLMMPSAVMNGVADPDGVWERYGPARGVDPDATNAVVAALAGYFVSQSLRPPPLNLPRVRQFQAAQGSVALRWLEQRLR